MEKHSSNLTSNCLDPSFALQSFDSLRHCFQEFGEPEDPYWLTVSNDNSLAVVLRDCISQYCQEPQADLGGCGQTATLSDQISLAPYSTNFHIECFAAPGCEGINDSVDQDIAGVGVVVSYLMAIGIILYIWILTELLHCLPPVSGFFRTLQVRTSWWAPEQTKATAQSQGNQLRDRLKRKFSHHVFVLKSTLIQFQEAQCFFMLAVQVTVITGLGAGSSILGSASMAQLQITVATVVVIAMLGVLPNIFCLWLLHRAEMASWYILFWSTVTLGASTASLSLGARTPAASQINFPVDASRLDKCGYNPPPLIYCLSSHDYLYDSSNTPIFLIVDYICWAYYGWILAMKIGSTLRKRVNRPWYRRILYNVDSVVRKKWVRVVAVLLSALSDLMFACFFLIYTITLTTQTYASLNLETSSWSFGQVIAVTLWAPVLCKYFYWAIFGTDSYSAVHIPKPFKIVRISTGDTASPFGDKDGVFLHLTSETGRALVHSSSIKLSYIEIDPGENTAWKDVH